MTQPPSLGSGESSSGSRLWASALTKQNSGLGRSIPSNHICWGVEGSRGQRNIRSSENSQNTPRDCSPGDLSRSWEHLLRSTGKHRSVEQRSIHMYHCLASQKSGVGFNSEVNSSVNICIPSASVHSSLTLTSCHQHPCLYSCSLHPAPRLAVFFAVFCFAFDDPFESCRCWGKKWPLKYLSLLFLITSASLRNLTTIQKQVYKIMEIWLPTVPQESFTAIFFVLLCFGSRIQPTAADCMWLSGLFSLL